MEIGEATGSKETLVRLIAFDQVDSTVRPTVGTAAALAASVAAALTAGMVGGAQAAPGDLDPAFGDVGRVARADLHGDLWSVQVRDDESIDFLGGYEYCYWGCELFDFVGHVDAFGMPDPTYTAAELHHTQVFDTVLLDDGRLIGTGTVGQSMIVFRLLANGTLDASFGIGGRVTIGDNSTPRAIGHSVLVEDDGRIVVGGASGSALLVVRLLADGTPDTTFGTQGVFREADTAVIGGEPTRIARSPDGGYRVMSDVASAGQTPCSIVGVTDAGQLDTSFGEQGILHAPGPPDESLRCRSFAMLAGGDMIVAANGDAGAYLHRWQITGQDAPGFDPVPASTRFSKVTALAVSTTGRIFVAGADRSGLLAPTVARLLANGTFDAAFGQSGAMTLDARAARPNSATIRDLAVRAGDAIVVGGDMEGRPMLARLLGNAGGSGPGVIGLEMPWNTIVHEGGKAVAKVRRAGGSAGSATVSYVVRPITGGGASQQDFEARSGELTWADGDSGDKEIDVSIASDSESEDPELFEIALESTTGGAGLGTSGAEFEIAGRTYPHGEFGFDYQQIDVAEDTDLYFNVTRFYYGEGAASVTVQVTGGDATPGTDFTLVGANASNAIVLNWADGQWGNRTVHVRVPRDTAVEPREMVQLELVSPSGATLGANSRLTIGIANSIPPPPPPPPNNGGRGSSNGGGQFAGIEAMMLGLLAMLRRCLRGRRHD